MFKMLFQAVREMIFFPKQNWYLQQICNPNRHSNIETVSFEHKQ